MRGEEVGIAARTFPCGPDRDGALCCAVQGRNGRQINERIRAAKSGGRAEGAFRPLHVGEFYFELIRRAIGGKSAATFVQWQPEQKRRIRRWCAAKGSKQAQEYQRCQQGPFHDVT